MSSPARRTLRKADRCRWSTSAGPPRRSRRKAARRSGKARRRGPPAGARVENGLSGRRLRRNGKNTSLRAQSRRPEPSPNFAAKRRRQSQFTHAPRPKPHTPKGFRMLQNHADVGGSAVTLEPGLFQTTYSCERRRNRRAVLRRPGLLPDRPWRRAGDDQWPGSTHHD